MLTINLGDAHVAIHDPARDLPVLREALEREFLRGGDATALFPTLTDEVLASPLAIAAGATVAEGFARIYSDLRLEAVLVDALRGGVPVEDGVVRARAEITEARAAAATLSPPEAASLLEILADARPAEEVEASARGR